MARNRASIGQDRGNTERNPASVSARIEWRVGGFGFVPPPDLSVQEQLFDGKWQYWQLGYGGNGSRRLRQLYDLLNLPAAASAKAQYQQAQQQTASVYMQPPFFVLDRDDEFIAWSGNAPDFHPRRGMPCSLDTNLASQSVQGLLSQIDGQPRPPFGAARGVPASNWSAPA